MTHNNPKEQHTMRINRQTSSTVDTRPIRQGDVLLIPTRTFPSGLSEVPLENGRMVLAHGEVTGHAHVIEGDAMFLAGDLDEMSDRFLRVMSECAFVHDEHNTLAVPVLPDGWDGYTVRRQREYTPERIVNVAD